METPATTDPGSRILHPASRIAPPLLYEINTRCWLSQFSDTRGRGLTLATVPDSVFGRWQELGVTHVWLMGVWATGPRSRSVSLAAANFRREAVQAPAGPGDEDIGGSPYAIAGYFVPETLGGESGLQVFRQRLHRRGMRLILDFIPNHVGLDHPWLSERPDLFVQGRHETPETFAQNTRAGLRHFAHGRDPHFPPWTDTAQLDYRLPATRDAMLESLLAVAARCDGVRCDMAMLVLKDVFEKTWARFPIQAGASGLFDQNIPDSAGTEFWPEAIALTKQAHPGCLFLAEVYWGLEERLQSLGFDYTYDKELYDELVRRNPAGVQRRVLEAAPRFLDAGIHFLENHDEARIASILSLEEHRAAALLVLGLPGMRLLYHGQLEGALDMVPVQLRRHRSEPIQEEIVRMYRQLFAGLRRTAVGRGKVAVLKPCEASLGNPTAQNFVLVQWQAEPPDFDLVAVNLAPHRSQCYARPAIQNMADHAWLIEDRVGSEVYRRSGGGLEDPGLYLDMPGHGAQLLHFKAAPECR